MGTLRLLRMVAASGCCSCRGGASGTLPLALALVTSAARSGCTPVTMFVRCPCCAAEVKAQKEAEEKKEEEGEQQPPFPWATAASAQAAAAAAAAGGSSRAGLVRAC